MLNNRVEARKAGDKFYYNGPCANGHDEKRRTSTGTCMQCERDLSKKVERLDVSELPDDELPSTRAEAVKLNLSHYFTGTPCKHGHVSRRHTNKRNCMECWRVERARNYAANKDKINERRRQARLKNVEEHRALDAERYKREAEKRKQHARNFRRDNPDKVAELSASKHATKMQRTPVWADRKEIKKVYTRCYNINQRTGVNHQVDHVIPLRGKLVSGLHVHNNLQILTAKVNLSKSNRFEL